MYFIEYDYFPGPYNVTFTTGIIYASFDIKIFNDTVPEGNKIFIVDINNTSLPSGIKCFVNCNAKVVIKDGM